VPRERQNPGQTVSALQEPMPTMKLTLLACELEPVRWWHFGSSNSKNRAA
jgi:hypothetical protein